jgi:hypothetical protein
VLHDGIRYTFTRPSPPATAEPDRGDSPTVGADAESALPDGHDDRSTGRTHAAESLGDEGRD